MQPLPAPRKRSQSTRSLGPQHLEALQKRRAVQVALDVRGGPLACRQAHTLQGQHRKLRGGCQHAAACPDAPLAYVRTS